MLFNFSNTNLSIIYLNYLGKTSKGPSLRRLKMYKELDKLVVKAKKGDKESKEEILNRLEGLVINSIKKYYNNVHEYDDLIQEGNMVILESIASYDKRKGVYFLGYIKIMLRYSYLNNHKKRQHLSLNVEAKNGEGDELLNLLES